MCTISCKFPPNFSRGHVGMFGDCKGSCKIEEKVLWGNDSPSSSSSWSEGLNTPLPLPEIFWEDHPQWFQAILWGLSPASSKPLHGDDLFGHWRIRTPCLQGCECSLTAVFTVCRIPASFPRLVWRNIWPQQSTDVAHRVGFRQGMWLRSSDNVHVKASDDLLDYLCQTCLHSLVPNDSLLVYK